MHDDVSVNIFKKIFVNVEGALFSFGHCVGVSFSHPNDEDVQPDRFRGNVTALALEAALFCCLLAYFQVETCTCNS